MTIHKRREVEVKFFLGADLAALEPYRALLLACNFQLDETRLETDFLPDTPDGLCKKHGVLLRFRGIQSKANNRWLLTLKTRNQTEGFLDFQEIETSFDDPRSTTFDHINKILFDITGHRLDAKLLHANSLEGVAKETQAAGFTDVRILLEKYREEYSAQDVHVTLDYFPDGMGLFLEVEGYSPKKVVQAYTKLGLKKEDVVTTDYGDLLKLHKSGLPPKEQRQALFSAKERHNLLPKGQIQ